MSLYIVSSWQAWHKQLCYGSFAQNSDYGELQQYRLGLERKQLCNKGVNYVESQISEGVRDIGINMNSCEKTVSLWNKTMVTHACPKYNIYPWAFCRLKGRVPKKFLKNHG
mgnify:CR=1 FL=1